MKQRTVVLHLHTVFQKSKLFDIIIIYLISKMEEYSWIKQENTEQGEPGSYEHLRKPLHAYSLSNLIQWKRSNIHKNIKH